MRVALFAPSAIQKSAGRGAVIGAYLGERHRRRRRRPRPAGDRARAERTRQFRGRAWRTRSARGRLANSRMRVGRRRAVLGISGAVVTGTHRRRLLLDPRVELALLVFEHLHQVTHRDRVCALARRASGCGETRTRAASRKGRSRRFAFSGGGNLCHSSRPRARAADGSTEKTGRKHARCQRRAVLSMATPARARMRTRRRRRLASSSSPLWPAWESRWERRMSPPPSPRARRAGAGRTGPCPWRWRG